MQNLMIFLYLLLFSLISTVLWICISEKRRKEWKSQQSVKEIIFFFLCNFFLISAAKTLLGGAESTLFESFWDIEVRTYINYGIPLLAFSLIAPVVIRFLFKDKSVKLISSFDAIIFIALILVLISRGKISNSGYSVAFIVSVCIALLYSVFDKKEMEYIGKIEYKKYILGMLPVIAAWGVTIGIYLPNELYLANYSQFSGSYGVFLAITFFGSIICGLAILLVGVLLLPKKLFKLFNLLLAGIICMGYLQIMFLNGELKALDGVDQIWSAGTQAVNLAIWMLVIIFVVVVGYKKELVEKACKILCIYIALIQIVTLGVLIVTTDYSSEQSQEAMTTQGSLELAPDGNVLVFVLDCFESSWFEDIVEEDVSIIEPLADFTYYRNGTSQFAHTDNAIPYMLTGVAWKEDIAGNYPGYAYENSDALRKIAEQGYDIGIYTGASYLSDSAKILTTNYSDNVQRVYAPVETLKLMTKASMYKMVPFTLKPEYLYYSGDVFSLAKSDEVWNIDNDLLFYNSLIQRGLIINEELENTFRFYHMRGPHAPFYLSGDIKYEPTGREVTLSSQGRGSLKIVYEYLEQMKELGIYDDATIIITADHGQGYILDSDKTSGKPDRTSRPIFIVKKPNEHGEAMKVSNAPVSQAELLPTVLEAAGVDRSNYGRTFAEISEEEQRERMYVDVYSYFTVQYTINGDAADINSWDIKKAVYQK